MTKIEWEYNVPAENTTIGQPDVFLKITSCFLGRYSKTNEPMTSDEVAKVYRPTLHDYSFLSSAMHVKDWIKVYDDIKKISQQKFNDLFNENAVSLAEKVLAA